MSLPSELFTPQSILTLTGATGAVYVVCAGLQRAFDFNPRWLALALSLVLAIAGAHATQPHVAATYLVAVVNGFLIYCTALGVNASLAPPAPVPVVPKGAVEGELKPPPPKRRMLRSRWV